ncbi:MAG: C25 family cysteine peptidase, partial [candidate division WOR-3 bacterium]
MPFSLLPSANAMATLVLKKLLGRDFPLEQTGYLIVVPDEFYFNVLPLARWKQRQGYVVWVKRTSEIGSTREQIRSYVRDAFRNCNPTPSYLLLVGAANKIQPFVTPGTSCVTDHPFVCVDGDDYLADMFVGRLPAANSSELDAMIAKIIGYESVPYLGDTSWFTRALMVGTSYQEGGSPATTALVTLRQIREKLLQKGYSVVDTVFYPPTLSGRGPVDSAVNRGVLFVNGRGWGNTSGWGYPQFNVSDVFNLANGWRLPVVTSIYCGTGNFVSGVTPCFGEAWLRAGTPQNPKGGVAFWGSSYTGTSTRWNNCMAYGIYHAIFDENVATCGQAMYAGKLEQLINFPLDQDSFDLRLYFHVYNLLGDPAMELWTGVPRHVRVVYPEIYPFGTSIFDVRVADEQNRPVRNARVCLYAPTSGVHELVLSDHSGWARFAIPATSADTLLVTVTGQGCYPYLGAAIGRQTGLWVGHLRHYPETAAAAATLQLSVSLKNFGSTLTARNVVATLRSQSDYATVIDSTASCGDVEPGSLASVEFSIRLAPEVPNGERIRFLLLVTSSDSVWHSAFELVVSSPELTVLGYTVHDGNGVLDPGDTVDISVTLLNRGELARDVTGLLRSLNPIAVTVMDSVGFFGTILPGDSSSNSGERFRVRVARGIGAGRRFSMRIALSGAGGFISERDFILTVGTPAASTPLGPDYYGYYCYDNTDTAYAERPSYAWIEIDPNLGGSGTRVEIGNDRAVAIDLPFIFRFYGSDYCKVSVSDNGYLAMGITSLGDPYNWTIPSANGPDALCAVFWDDFRTDTLGIPGVFIWYDEPNHLLVFEWSRCRHVHGFRNPIVAEEQTFERVLFDPRYYRTPTGDGPILFQYHTV